MPRKTAARAPTDNALAEKAEREVRAALGNPRPRRLIPPGTKGDDTLRPLCRIIGGKRASAKALWARFPEPSTIRVYAEPFCGFAAVFGHGVQNGYLRPGEQRCILVDISAHLIALLTAVRSDPEGLLYTCAMRYAEAYARDPKLTYAAVRSAWNDGKNRDAAMYLFLRQTLFNGLWRETKYGAMNTPRGDTNGLRLPGIEVAKAWQGALQHVELIAGDYTDAVSILEPDDLAGYCVYCDPPYLGGEVNYAHGGWTEADLIELVKWCAELDERGAFVGLSNHDHPLVRDALEAHWPRALISPLEERRAVNSDGNKRGPVPTVLAHSVGRP